MTELTKEQLIEEAKLKIAIAKCHPNSVMARVEGELFKIALASLEAEPVGEFYEYKPGDWYQRSAGDKAPKWIQLYAVPPALAAPEGLVKAVRFYEQVKRENPPVETGAWKDAVDWVVKEACSAAILDKADNPQASGKQVNELTMWVKRLAHSLKYANRLSCLPDKAMEYLNQNGLISAEDALR